MSVNRILCTVPSTAVPRSAFLRHDINKIASFEFWEGDSLMPKEVLIEKIQHFDALLTDPFHEVDNEVIRATDGALKIIADIGVGYDNIDIKFLKEKKISLLVTGSTTSVSPAEHIMFMILNISKSFNLFDQSVRQGKFDTIMHMQHNSFELFNKKILIVGFGRIGKQLIKKCLGFEMKIFVYDPYIEKKVIESLGGKKINNLDDALKETDVLSLSVPLTKDTYNMINLEKMKKMKKTSIIVNTSRGGVVNEKDLNTALDKEIIYGAGIDVFEKEPPSKDNPLLKNKKVLLSPHAATFTKECSSKMAIQTAQNIIDFFENNLKKLMIVKL